MKAGQEEDGLGESLEPLFWYMLGGSVDEGSREKGYGPRTIPLDSLR